MGDFLRKSDYLKRGNAPAGINEPAESHISKMSIYDYFVLCEDARPLYKIVGIITSKQVAFQVARGDLDDHLWMDIALNQAMFPKRNYDGSDYYRNGIEIGSTGRDLFVELPKEISLQQYQSLLRILDQVKKFEIEYEREIELLDVDAVLKEAKTKLSSSYPIENDERIVGTPIDEHTIIESMNKELNIDNCKDAGDLKRIVLVVSKYYNDSYFKNIILKMVPNAKQIVKLSKELSILEQGNSVSDIQLSIENISYDNICDYMQQLLNLMQQNEYRDDYFKRSLK